MVAKAYVPDRGDLVWVSFNPVRWHEQKGRRPALVISEKIYNNKSDLMLACPITSHEKGYPFEVPLRGKVIGAVIVDHIRSLDWKERSVKKIGTASPAVFLEVQEKLTLLVLE